MTHGHELRGGMMVGMGCRVEGNKEEEKNGTTVIAQSVKYTLKNYSTQWNTMQQKERRSFYPAQQHGWNWRALC